MHAITGENTLKMIGMNLIKEKLEKFVAWKICIYAIHNDWFKNLSEDIFYDKFLFYVALRGVVEDLF
jgi:hypothetical protein